MTYYGYGFCLANSAKSKCGASWVSGNIDLVGSPTGNAGSEATAAEVTLFYNGGNSK
jgi:hypothetical protein